MIVTGFMMKKNVLFAAIVIFICFLFDTSIYAASNDLNICDCNCYNDAKLYFEIADRVYDNESIDKNKDANSNWQFIESYSDSDYCIDLGFARDVLSKATCSYTKEECSSDGFYAALYKHKEKELYALAFRGTNGLSEDWLANIGNFLGIDGAICKNSQYDKAYRITDELITKKLANKSGQAELVTVGHSLGGGLASFAASMWRLKSYTYNPARDAWSTILSPVDSSRVNVYITYDKSTNIKDVVSSYTGDKSKESKEYHLPTTVSGTTPKAMEDLAQKLFKLWRVLNPHIVFDEISIGLLLHGRNNFIRSFQQSDCNQFNNCKNIKSETPKPLAIAIAFDKSGSMADERKIDYAREASFTYAREMKAEDLLSLSTFSNDAVTPAGLEIKSKAEISRKLAEILPTVQPDGQTNIGAGLASGLKQLCSVPSDKLKKGALLLSDGMNNVGSYNDIVNQYRDLGIPIYTVKFGQEASEKDLRDIAAQTSGIYMDSDTTNLTDAYRYIYAAINGDSLRIASHDPMGAEDKLGYEVDVSPDAKTLQIGTSWQGSRLKTVLISPSGESDHAK